MGLRRADKDQIHLEYISTDISMRGLANKYKLSKSTLQRWIKEEDWAAEKADFLRSAAHQAHERLQTQKAQLLEELTDRGLRVQNCTDKLIDRVEQVLALEDALAPRDLKSISSVLLDIQMIKAQGEDKQQTTTEWRVDFVRLDNATNTDL